MSAGSWPPPTPKPRTRHTPSCSTTLAPSARTAAAVRRTSSPVSRPLIVVSPSAIAPNMSERCDTDLSPGARTWPPSRDTGWAISLEGAAEADKWTPECGAAPSYHARIWF